jgi:hypothetical protein
MRDPPRSSPDRPCKQPSGCAPLPSPDPPGSSWSSDEEALRHRFLTYTVPSCSPGPTHPVVLSRPDFVAAAPTLPGVSRIRLPPASPARYDGPVTESFHLHSEQQRLVAHHRPSDTLDPRRRGLRPPRRGSLRPHRPGRGQQLHDSGRHVGRGSGCQPGPEARSPSKPGRKPPQRGRPSRSGGSCGQLPTPQPVRRRPNQPEPR